jgi:uncharacterized membrane protein YhaH (DUF805 family)
MDWNKLFFSADGRIGRQAFWIGFLILLGAGVVLGWIPLLGIVVSLALIYPWTCLFAKRFHDMGKSGWFALIPIAAPAVLFTIALAMGIGGIVSGAVLSDKVSEDAAAGPVLAGIGGALLFMSLGFLVWLGGTIWAGATPGDPGPNRYGPPPPPPTAGVAPPAPTSGPPAA